MSDTNGRLSAIEDRLARIERALNLTGAEPETAPTPAAAKAQPAGAARSVAQSRLSVTTTQLMAWAASIAFILAAGYFVKLVYDAGWLTPERQIGFAFLVGLALIAGGMVLARFDRDYAAYMPSVGVVVLYLATYAGHIFYGMFGLQLALVGVGTITIGALWLGRRFDNSMYALLAVVGTYLTPLLIRSMRVDLTDLVIYFTAWSLLFSFVALQERRRTTYLVALYFALLGFDIAFRLTDESAWALAAGYQFAQFLIFSLTAMLFSVWHKQPMRDLDAILHGVALFYFYIIEYILLKEHLPFWAPIIALISVGVVLGLFLLARALLDDPKGMRASAMLVSSYAAIVTAHVLFFELLPEGWIPWAALLLPVFVGLIQTRFTSDRIVFLPVLIVAALMFAMGYIYIVTADASRGEIPLPDVLLFLYAASLYAAYALFRRRRETYLVAPVTLYAAHAAFLAATIRVLESGLWISVSWGVFAVVLLAYAVKREDKVVGQSSLIIFAASGLKVLLFDLSDSAPMVRVLTLVVLAVSLYAGGWLYQRMSHGEVRFHPDRAVNDQLNVIRRLSDEGLDEAGIADELERRNVPCLAPEGQWSVDIVSRIRKDYGLG